MCAVARAKSTLARAGISYSNRAAASSSVAEVHVGAAVIPAPSTATLEAGATSEIEAFRTELRAALDRAGYPAAADPATIDRPIVVMVIALVSIFAAARPCMTSSRVSPKSSSIRMLYIQYELSV